MGDRDYQMALMLQRQYEEEQKFRKPVETSNDLQMALLIQEDFVREKEMDKIPNNLYYDDKKNKNKNSSRSLVDPSWELVDPTPNIHNLFMVFNEKFFWNKLLAVCVSWSKRMTSCAGICTYNGRGGMCSITLSEPLLKLRPRKDLVETLLHEMIHAYLFVTRNNRDRDGHGPEFHKHMYRINGEAGTNITVYHNFHDEVRLYQQHWWRCNGPCQKWKPYFGMVRRATNRAPGPNDRWWGEHARNCGGEFIKVKEPEKPQKNKKVDKAIKENKSPIKNDIRNYITVTKSPNKTDTVNNINETKSTLKSSNVTANKTPIKRNGNIFGLGNFNKSPIKNNFGNVQSKINSRNIKSADNSNKVKGNIFGFKEINETTETAVRSNSISTSRKRVDNTNNANGNVVGFKDMNKKMNTGVRSNSSSTIVVNQKNPNASKISSSETTTNSNNTLRRSNSVNINVYSSVGKTAGTTASTTGDYEVVRNAWLKKFENNSNKKTASSSVKSYDNGILSQKTESKRPPVGNQDLGNTAKKPKLEPTIEDLTSSENSADYITCPICNKKFPPNEINDHLDICLQSQSNSPDLHMEECAICGKLVPKSELENHMSDCLNESFGDEDFFSEDLMMDCTNCNKKISPTNFEKHACDKDENSNNKGSQETLKSKNHVAKNVTEEGKNFIEESHKKRITIERIPQASREESNTQKKVKKKSTDDSVIISDDGEGATDSTKCVICEKLIESGRYNSHVEKCLLNFYDAIERKYKTNIPEVQVSCLVCNQSVEKSKLDAHLEDCMNTVFDDVNDFNLNEINCDKKKDTDASSSKDVDCDSTSDGIKYNCPVCMLPVLESEMNNHLDVCLC